MVAKAIEAFTVAWTKVRRVYWQWRAADVQRAVYTGRVPKERCVYGVTLSGGEFTPGGEHGFNYGYPTRESIDYYASKGMGVIRLPFLWERVQPVMYGDLDVIEMARIDTVVNHALARGLQVGIDVHNGGRGYGGLIGGPDTPNSAFADLWSKLARHYQRDHRVIFMLMSEPSDQPASQWVKSANAAIQAIRRAGAAHLIVVPGSYFDGGWTWNISDNAEVVGKGIFDPLHNYMFEVHQYLDKDGSGGTSQIVSPTIGADRLSAITQWARDRGHKLFLGEFGVGADTQSLVALTYMLQYIGENSDVWAFACWWGAGRFDDYFMSIEPADHANPVDAPQMNGLKGYI
jgi:endoglucanase